MLDRSGHTNVNNTAPTKDPRGIDQLQPATYPTSEIINKRYSLFPSLPPRALIIREHHPDPIIHLFDHPPPHHSPHTPSLNLTLDHVVRQDMRRVLGCFCDFLHVGGGGVGVGVGVGGGFDGEETREDVGDVGGGWVAEAETEDDAVEACGVVQRIVVIE